MHIVAMLLTSLACAANPKGPSEARAPSSPSALHGQPPAATTHLPDFRATNRDGQARTRDDLIGTPTVVWFYPSAATSGCTKEGCLYRDLQPEFDALGVRIVGVSFNAPEKNQAWAQEQGYQYELWSDQDKTLALALGAVSTSLAPMPSRVTRLIGADGTVLLEYKVSDIGTHPADVLDDCRRLFGG